MSWEDGGGLEGVAVLVIESSLAGSKDDGSTKSGGSAGHVHNPGSGEIDHTDIKESVFAEGSQEAIVRPNRVHNNGVDLFE